MPNMEQMNGQDPIEEAFNSIGVTCLRVAKKYKKLMNAKVTKTQKLKGCIPPGELARGIKVMATSGYILRDDDGDMEAGDGDTIISWKENDNRTQRESTRDVATMRGYFKDKGESRDNKLEINVVYDEKPPMVEESDL